MRYYTEDHEWIEINGDEAVIGISEYAADELGEVTFIELPEEDDSCDIYAPISGTVCAVNEALADEPELINESPEEKGWICRLTNYDSSELDDMMNETAYRKYLQSL